MDSHSYTIKAYTAADYDELVDFWEPLGLGGKHRGDDAGVIAHTLQMGAKLLLMRWSDGQLIGSSWLTQDGRRAYIHHFGIHKDFQGRKLALALLDATMEEVRQMGLQCKLEVHRLNVPALNLYAKAGYKYLGDYDVYIVRDI